MFSKKRGVIFGSAVALLTFIPTAWFSCTKPSGNAYTCDYVYCDNGGVCSQGKCTCPTGYEGPRCATESIAKYVGIWKVKQTIIGSTETNTIGMDSVYSINFKKSSTPTTFMVDNFYGDPTYNNLICILDSINTLNFRFDATPSFHMAYSHFRIIDGDGKFDAADRVIESVVRIRHLDATSNWQTDTLHMVFTPFQ